MVHRMHGSRNIRRDFILFLLLFTPCFMALADEQTQVDLLSNAWIKASIQSEPIPEMKQLSAYREKLIWQAGEGKSIPSLQLFSHHPLNSTHTIELPSSYTTQKIDQNDGRTLSYSSSRSTDVSLTRSFSMSGIESVLHVTTTITNQSKKTLQFYPTEVHHFKATVGETTVANTLLYFYSPYVPSPQDHASYHLIQGEQNPQQFNQIPAYKIFLARYNIKSGVVKLTHHRQWFAVQNLIQQGQIQSGTACAVEYEFPGQQPQAVKDNLVLSINGVDNLIKKQIDPKASGIDPYLQVQYVLGKVTLKPGAAFTYSSRWTLVCCKGPITTVKKGIVYSKSLDIYAEIPQGHFYNYANLGIPQEGSVAFMFYDKDEKDIKIKDSEGKDHRRLLRISLANKKRKEQVTPFLPTDIHHFTQTFSPEEFKEGENDYTRLMNNVHSIRMYLIDKDRNLIRELDRFYAPFKQVPQTQGAQ